MNKLVTTYVTHVKKTNNSTNYQRALFCVSAQVFSVIISLLVYLYWEITRDREVKVNYMLTTSFFLLHLSTTLPGDIFVVIKE